MPEDEIRVSALARVEGEGALRVVIDGDEVRDVQLDIYEPPRFFEALLRGRSYLDPVDLTARICGICPVAYQMSAAHAIEDACGVRVGEPLRSLRRLIYCGEWIESHALHIYLLHAPDFLGYPSSIEMARDHADLVARGLAIKKVGNEVVSVVGGRSVHPINVRVGGFHRAPERAGVRALAGPLEEALRAAEDTVRWVAGFDFPDLHRDWRLASLRHPGEYPFNEGRIVTSDGLDIEAREFESHFVESQARYSNALRSTTLEGDHYLVGPLARYNLDQHQLAPAVRGLAREAGLGPTCSNPFQSIIVRALELVQTCAEALALVSTYEEPDRPFEEVPARPGRGYSCTEAPRGTLYHRYTLDEQGLI